MTLPLGIWVECVELICCTEAVAGVKWRQPCLWICAARSGTLLAVVKAENSQEPSLTFYSVISVAAPRHVLSFPARRLQTEHLAPTLSLSYAPPRTLQSLSQGGNVDKVEISDGAFIFRLHPAEGCLSASYQNVRPSLE